MNNLLMYQLDYDFMNHVKGGCDNCDHPADCECDEDLRPPPPEIIDR